VKIAFPTDEHYPYQDERARSLALEIVRDFDPDLLITGSDGLDFYALSNFSKNPKRIGQLQKEIDAWKVGQREWKDAAPDARRSYLKGNHEDRLRKWLWEHPEMHSLDALKLSGLLGFDELGIEYNVDEDSDWANSEYVFGGTLVIRHGNLVRKGSGMSARAELDSERFSISILTGHTHRGGSIFTRTRTGVIQGHECFCLCSLEPEYVRHPDWQQGIVLAEVHDRDLIVEPVPFNSLRCIKHAIWRGKEYRS
jgi:hypothetical protein